MSTLPQYREPEDACAKCGLKSDGLSGEWCTVAYSDGRQGVRRLEAMGQTDPLAFVVVCPESLAFTCRRCGYWYETEPKDASATGRTDAELSTDRSAESCVDKPRRAK